jgi:hypothetical protein
VAKTVLCLARRIVCSLGGALNSISLSQEEDVWEFAPDRGGKHSVKINYLHLCQKHNPSYVSSLSSVTRRLGKGFGIVGLHPRWWCFLGKPC